MVGTPGELLSRRCVALLKTALKPDVWPQQCDLKLSWFDKVFASVESGSPNYGNICTALELLTFLLGVMKKEQILASCKPLQRGIAACITCSNSKVGVWQLWGEVEVKLSPPQTCSALLQLDDTVWDFFFGEVLLLIPDSDPDWLTDSDRTLL